MTAPRATLALVATTSASVTAIATHHHHHRRPALASELASVHLSPLPFVKRPHPRKGTSSSRSSLRVARPAGGSGTLSDVTMYCRTGNRNAAGRWPELGDVAVADRSIRFGTRVAIDGNVYTVRDWIGWDSDFDIYGGSDAGCEHRALDFGRRRLRVVVER